MENLFYFIVETGKVWSIKAAHAAKSFDAGYAFSQDDYAEFVAVMRSPTLMRNEVEMMDVLLKRGKWPKSARKTFTETELLATFNYVSPDHAKELFTTEELADPTLVETGDPRIAEMAENCDMQALLPA